MDKKYPGRRIHYTVTLVNSINMWKKKSQRENCSMVQVVRGESRDGLVEQKEAHAFVCCPLTGTALPLS
jgi:hypothetical protein